MEFLQPRDAAVRTELRWGELHQREKLVLIRQLQDEFMAPGKKKEKYASFGGMVVIEESRQLGLNILTGKPNLDEYYIFVDYDYEQFTPHVKKLLADGGEDGKPFKELKSLVKKLEADLNDVVTAGTPPNKGENISFKMLDDPECICFYLVEGLKDVLKEIKEAEGGGAEEAKGEEQIDSASKPAAAGGEAAPKSDPFLVPGQVMEEMTEEKYQQRWDYAFSDEVLETFKKRYGAIAYQQKLFDGRGFVIIRCRRFKKLIEEKHVKDTSKLDEDEKKAALAEEKPYKYDWKTNIILNISGMETYAKQLRAAAEKSVIQRYLTLPKNYLNYLRSINEPDFKVPDDFVDGIGQERPLGLFLSRCYCVGFIEQTLGVFERKSYTQEEELQWPMRFRLKGAPDVPEPIEEATDKDPYWRPNENPILNELTFRPLPLKEQVVKPVETKEEKEERRANIKAARYENLSEVDSEEWEEDEPTSKKNDKNEEIAGVQKDGVYTKPPPFIMDLVGIPAWGLNKEIQTQIKLEKDEKQSEWDGKDGKWQKEKDEKEGKVHNLQAKIAKNQALKLKQEKFKQKQMYGQDEEEAAPIIPAGQADNYGVGKRDREADEDDEDKEDLTDYPPIIEKLNKELEEATKISREFNLANTRPSLVFDFHAFYEELKAKYHNKEQKHFVECVKQLDQQKMLKLKYKTVNRETMKMTYQCERCYEVIDPYAPEDVIQIEKGVKEFTVFSRRYVSINELDSNICHKCFNLRMTEDNHAAPVMSEYEKKINAMDKARKANLKTKVQIDDQVFIIKKTDTLFTGGKKKKPKNLMKDVDLPVEEKAKKYVAPAPQRFEFFWCVMRPMRWIHYKSIQGPKVPITWHPDFKEPEEPEEELIEEIEGEEEEGEEGELDADGNPIKGKMLGAGEEVNENKDADGEGEEEVKPPKSEGTEYEPEMAIRHFQYTFEFHQYDMETDGLWKDALNNSI